MEYICHWKKPWLRSRGTASQQFWLSKGVRAGYSWSDKERCCWQRMLSGDLKSLQYAPSLGPDALIL